MKRPKVHLVGAGPGDPELLTLKAVRLLKEADVVVYDRLVAPEIMELVPKGAARIFVGKASSNHTLQQDEINEPWSVSPCRGGVSSASRAEIRSSSGAAARRRSISPRTASIARSCPASPPRRLRRRVRDPAHASRARDGAALRHRSLPCRRGARSQLGKPRRSRHHARRLHGTRQSRRDRDAARRRGAAGGDAGRRDRERDDAAAADLPRDARRPAGRGRGRAPRLARARHHRARRGARDAACLASGGAARAGRSGAPCLGSPRRSPSRWPP